jgi:hypothetical protein
MRENGSTIFVAFLDDRSTKEKKNIKLEWKTILFIFVFC